MFSCAILSVAARAPNSCAAFRAAMVSLLSIQSSGLSRAGPAWDPVSSTYRDIYPETLMAQRALWEWPMPVEWAAVCVK